MNIYSTAPRIPPGLGVVHRLCWMTSGILGPAWLKRPRDSLKFASSWLSWGQVGSKLAQVGLMLGPSCLQVGSSWPMLAPSWLPLKTIRKVTCPTSQNHTQSDTPYHSNWPQVGSKLAPCWLMLAPCWLILDQMASKIAEDAIMLTQVGLKMANMASNSKF